MSSKSFILCAVLAVGLSASAQISNPTSGASGTVTSVTGTANQVTVGGTATDPVISLPSVITLPGTVNKYTFTAPATAATLAITDNKSISFTNSIVFSGTDSTTMTFPATSATIARTDAAQTFTGAQTFNTGLSTTTYATSQNCSNVGSGSAVTCGTAPVGAFACPTTQTGATCVVATTRVTANSDIQLTMDASNGTRLSSSTCNTAVTSGWYISARSAGVSFTVTMPAFTTNPLCFNFAIVN